jgi:hypothetical protein
MNKSSLIAMALAAAAFINTDRVAIVPPAVNRSPSGRGYRKFGQHGAEQRKAWLIAKNKETLAKNAAKRMGQYL